MFENRFLFGKNLDGVSGAGQAGKTSEKWGERRLERRNWFLEQTDIKRYFIKKIDEKRHFLFAGCAVGCYWLSIFESFLFSSSIFLFNSSFSVESDRRASSFSLRVACVLESVCSIFVYSYMKLGKYFRIRTDKFLLFLQFCIYIVLICYLPSDNRIWKNGQVRLY
jgi:hypothetical protein